MSPGSTASANTQVATSASPFRANRDQPVLMTRSEKGISAIGKRGLRIPPVSASATNMFRKRGTICSVSAE